MAANGEIAVQLLKAYYSTIDDSDALGAEMNQRDSVYSTCLGFFGSYNMQSEHVAHRIGRSVYLNWFGTVPVL